MKRSCELCKKKAEMYCESDHAFLCCACDVVVHSANFIVARHSRNLLCHVCMSVTEWTASGRKLDAAAPSVCRSCVVVEEDLSCTDENNNNNNNNNNINYYYNNNNDSDRTSSDDDDNEDDEEEEDDESVSGVESDEDEDGGGGGGDEVVSRWSTAAKKREGEEESTSEESTTGQRMISRKRIRLDHLPNNDDDKVSTSKIIPPPSTKVELEAVIGTCEESHDGKKEECMVETSTTSTNSVNTTKCRRVEIGRGRARTTEEMAFMIGK